jgi:hypothetical protein
MAEYEGLACGRLIACDALVGAPLVPPADGVTDLAHFVTEMARLRVSGAVVRHRACLQTSAHLGNDVLMEEIAGQATLIPAWFVTPDGRDPEYNPRLTLLRMLAAGGRLAWTDAPAQGFSLAPWCAGKLYEALQERRVPLLMEYATVNLNDLHDAMEAYPGLRVVLLQVPRVGRNRLVEPLLELHPELHLCFAPSFSIHCGWPDLCRRHGAHRFVWGSHYPEAEGGAAVTGLMYAGLAPEDLRAVAYGNLERLLAEVVL